MGALRMTTVVLPPFLARSGAEGVSALRNTYTGPASGAEATKNLHVVSRFSGNECRVTSSVSVTPGEIVVTRMEGSLSSRSPSVITRAADLVALARVVTQPFGCCDGVMPLSSSMVAAVCRTWRNRIAGIPASFGSCANSVA